MAGEQRLGTRREPTGGRDGAMLVLSRKVDQTIVIQGNITIKVLEIAGDRVKIGISAPRDVVILREELTGEGRRASRDSASDGSSSSAPSPRRAPEASGPL